ncbi:MAG TPA: Hsp70 family protein [Pseudonocardiaceae bacterium]|nr:Hsp70 family protein [Pseudonocardiaceae bacterium]
MSYWLGIDVGTTFTAAAICREVAGRRPLPEVIPLGSRSVAVSSVVYLGKDGQVVVGEAAERRAVTDPDRVVREFKRRIGDEVPMVIGGVSHSASEVAAMVVRWVVDRVAEREGEPAQGITITHPASWGAYKTRIMADALRAADLSEVIFRTEPEAAAASYSMQERVATGSTIAVYDLGGGTFDAAVVRKTGTGTFSVLGLPEGIERLGGVDFDEAVFGHVVAKVPALSELDPEAPATRAATARLRRECTEAKEALSADTEVTIPVLLPDLQSQVRLVRAEFEDLIRPQVAETVEALRRALRSADVGPQELDAVLLVGGSSRVPLVAQLVSAELGRPVAVDADPTVSIALGAALSALPAETADSDTASADVSPDAPILAAVVTLPTATLAGSDVAERSQVEVPHRPTLTAIPPGIEPAHFQWHRVRSRRVKQVAAAGFLALVLVGGAAAVPFLSSRSGPIPPADAGTPAPATPTPTPEIPLPVTPILVAPLPVTSAPVPAPATDAGSGSDQRSRSSGSSGAVRTTPTAARPTGVGTGAKGGAPVRTTAPPITWTTSWTNRSSSPSAPPPTTTTRPPPPPTTTRPPPPPTTTNPPPTTTTRPPSTTNAPE